MGEKTGALSLPKPEKIEEPRKEWTQNKVIVPGRITHSRKKNKYN